jgi:prevent-host-death family protein
VTWARSAAGRRVRARPGVFTLHLAAFARYGSLMEVPVSALRAELRSWIERAREGEEVVVTERGVPVARLTGIATADLVTELTRDGLLTPPTTERPRHTGVATPEDAPERVPDAQPVPALRSTRSGVAALVRRIRR